MDGLESGQFVHDCLRALRLCEREHRSSAKEETGYRGWSEAYRFPIINTIYLPQCLCSLDNGDRLNRDLVAEALSFAVYKLSRSVNCPLTV